MLPCIAREGGRRRRRCVHARKRKRKREGERSGGGRLVRLRLTKCVRHRDPCHRPREGIIIIFLVPIPRYFEAKFVALLLLPLLLSAAAAAAAGKRNTRDPRDGSKERPVDRSHGLVKRVKGQEAGGCSPGRLPHVPREVRSREIRSPGRGRDTWGAHEN